MPEAVIIEAIRTPFGRRGGALREARPDSLLAHTLRGLVDRAGMDPEKIEDVVDGTVTLAGEQAANPARLAVLLAGFPVASPRRCSTGFATLTVKSPTGMSSAE